MIIKPRPLPDHPDYKAACRQTVTLYNVYKVGSVSHYHRTLFDKCAFLDVQRLFREQTTGATANTGALLVIPVDAGGYQYVDPVQFAALADKSGVWTMQNNDKTIQGEGPEITTSTEWSKFTNANYPGLMVVKQIDPKRNLEGEIVHLEAGG